MLYKYKGEFTRHELVARKHNMKPYAKNCRHLHEAITLTLEELLGTVLGVLSVTLMGPLKVFPKLTSLPL